MMVSLSSRRSIFDNNDCILYFYEANVIHFVLFNTIETKIKEKY